MLVELLHDDYGLGIQPVALEDRSPIQLRIVDHTGTFHFLQELVSEEAVPYRRGMDPIQTRQPALAQSAVGVGMIVSRVDLGVDTVEVLRKVVLDLSGIAFEGNVLEHLENVDDVVTLL